MVKQLGLSASLLACRVAQSPLTPRTIPWSMAARLISEHQDQEALWHSKWCTPQTPTYFLDIQEIRPLKMVTKNEQRKKLTRAKEWFQLLTYYLKYMSPLCKTLFFAVLGWQQSGGTKVQMNLLNGLSKTSSEILLLSSTSHF